MMEIVEIVKTERETPTVVSLYFKWDKLVEPGQFVMIWVPGLGEVPMSLSLTDDLKCITVKAYGESTKKLSSFENGDKIFIRGPYGKPFKRIKGNKLLIGGGSGIASMRPLIDSETTGIVAARSSDELLFEREFGKEKFIAVTEDGSKGYKGVVTAGIDHVDLSQFERIYVCGPEKMMKSIFDKLKESNYPIEFSLERSMKCGIGICDSCSINGFQVCRDGPTFDMETVKTMTEFGNTKLLASGKRIKV